MKKVGPNEVQLSDLKKKKTKKKKDLTNQFSQMIIQDSCKKECSAIFSEKQTRI